MYYMDKKFFIPSVLITVIFMLLMAGCVTDEKRIDEELSAKQVMSKSIEAADTVKTYTFNTDIHMILEGDEGMPTGMDAEMSMSGDGEIDLINKKMKTNLLMSMLGMNMEMEQYVINDIQYMKIPMFGWVKNETSPDFWDQQMYAAVPEELMYGNARFLDDEQIDGEDCYVLSIEMDLQYMLDIISKQLGSASAMDNGELDSIIDASAVEWISKDTFLAKKVFMRMVMEQEGAVMNMSLAMEFYNYNEPVDIVLPDDAKNAMDMDSLGGLMTL